MDHIRVAKETGLRNLLLCSFNQKRIWVHIVQLALDLTAWMWTLALTHHEERMWEAKRLRYRLYQAPAVFTRPARTVHHADVLTLKGVSYRLRGRGINSLPSIRTTTDETPG